jgi:DNA-binding response OmpR family regulator
MFQVPRLLAGRCVLIVEDEPLLAFSLEDALRDAGADILGPAGRSREAFALLQRTRPDAAVLDLNLHGESSLPFADALHDQGIPYVFASAYPPSDLPSRHMHAGYLVKPFDLSDLVTALAAKLLPFQRRPAF